MQVRYFQHIKCRYCCRFHNDEWMNERLREWEREREANCAQLTDWATESTRRVVIASQPRPLLLLLLLRLVPASLSTIKHSVCVEFSNIKTIILIEVPLVVDTNQVWVCVCVGGVCQKNKRENNNGHVPSMSERTLQLVSPLTVLNKKFCCCCVF